MRLLKLITTCMLALFVVFTASARVTAAQKVRVTNGDEFLRALKSNTHIVIPEGAKIMLTEALEKKNLRNELGINEINTYTPDYNLYDKVETLGYYDNFDGNQLVVAGLSNLIIEGEGSPLKGPSIIVTPRYAYVLFFLCCQNVSLVNLTLGHTEEGYCEGGVVMFDHCSNVSLTHCDMYGCGTEGIGASYTQNIKCNNSHIRDCSYQIMTLANCSNIAFADCEFYRNKEFTLVNANACSDVSFTKCKFYDNRGVLFSFDNTHPLVRDCVVRHPNESLGYGGVVTWENTQFYNTEGEPYELSLDESTQEEEISYYDNDWSEKVLKVNSTTPNPGIVDFFMALAHKSNSQLIKSASFALNPPYKSAADIVEVDKKNGYIFVANLPENADPNDYRAVEACYWRCNDGSILFAVNHLLQEDFTTVNFYRYDSRRRLLNPIEEEMQQMSDDEEVYVSLPRIGKTIQYLQKSNPEKQQGVLTFDGSAFRYKKTGVRSVSVDNATNVYGIGNMVSFMRRYLQ